MKKILLSLLMMSVLVLSVVPGIFATSVGSGTGVTIITEDFAPQVWQCDSRVVYDDATEPGRISGDGNLMVERVNNYAFEGEQVRWNVLVMDKNGVEKIKDVYMTVDGQIEANCKAISDTSLKGCNARILEESITEFDSEIMQMYTCLLTVETPESMYGEYEVSVEAEDLDGIITAMDESEFWFLNPAISLAIQGDLVFDEVRPGTSAYSDLVLIENAADADSGVVLDMFISGTDFYDSSNSGAKCSTSNQLKLENFKYHATSGAYSTQTDLRSDPEGYVGIGYGIGFNDPTPFYNHNEIIQTTAKLNGVYYAGNVLTPGAELALTFRLDLPEPCNGDFDEGQIYFWGEAI